MSRRVRNGVAIVAGLLMVLYGLPLLIAVISLGEICPYSPSGTNLCGRSPSGPTQQPSAPTRQGQPSPEPVAVKLCKQPGIRYSGTTTEGAEVCFTLTPSLREWIEIGFKFVPASGCPRLAGATETTGTVYYEGEEALTGPGRITIPGFTATIRGARATGVLEDSKVCGIKMFKWTARRAP